MVLFVFIFYLLNIFKPLMRWSKYVNKYEIVIIFLSHLQPWQGVKTSKQPTWKVWRDIIYTTRSNDGK